MSFGKKLVKLGKTGLKAYASYQTGGLSGLATSALKKRAVRSMGSMMLQRSSSFGGGLTALPAVGASYTGGGGRFGGSGMTATFMAPSSAARAARQPRMTKDGKITMRKKHRINPANVKALRRSIRRLKGAEKLFRQVLTVEGKHHAGIKPKTSSRRK